MQEDDDDFINITALLRMLTHPCNKELNNYTTRNEMHPETSPSKYNPTMEIYSQIFRQLSETIVIWRQLTFV